MTRRAPIPTDSLPGERLSADLSLRRDLGILRYGVVTLIRSSSAVVLVPLFITLAVTVTQVLWRPDGADPSSADALQVSTGEVMGSLLAGFLGAHLLSAEFHTRAGEVIYTKPYDAWRLVWGRVVVILATVLALVGVNSLALELFRHLHRGPYALAAAIPPSLFLCSVACALFVASSNSILALIGPTIFWVWSTLGSTPPLNTRFDRLYNPILQISAWSGYLEDPSPATYFTLIANSLTLFVVSVLLLGWCCRRLRTAVLR